MNEKCWICPKAERYGKDRKILFLPGIDPVISQYTREWATPVPGSENVALYNFFLLLPHNDSIARHCWKRENNKSDNTEIKEVTSSNEGA
jgi:hypothetical protein